MQEITKSKHQSQANLKSEKYQKTHQKPKCPKSTKTEIPEKPKNHINSRKQPKIPQIHLNLTNLLIPAKIKPTAKLKIQVK